MPSPLSRLSRTYERSFKKNPSLTLAITNGCLKCLGDFLAQLLPSLLDGTSFTIDIHRSMRFMLFGLLHGPCIGKWHEFLEHRIPLTLTTGSRSQPSHMSLTQLETEKSPLSASQSSALHSIRNRAQSLSEETSHVRQFMASDPTLDAGSRIKPSRSRRMWGVAKRLMLDQLIMAPLFVFVFISFTAWLEGLSMTEIKLRLDDLYWHILTANWKIWPLIQIINFNFMPLQYRVPWQSSCGIVWTVFLSLSTHSHSATTTITPSEAVATAAAPSLVSSAVSNLFNKKPNQEEAPLLMEDSLARIGLGKLQRIKQAVVMGSGDGSSKEARLRRALHLASDQQGIR
ncbi:uncharacterized protein MELLADRAFT_115298 [Melampsora larici-populina 98AG31]|uniref:Uncharacterized protein n=1 Tax=Melampsora larici-populina (strain 98AG31 / pathotype 3-4-7) TaxID=747676 RepID=F4R774_MELLP|nr:uncharacterized protein MELLADRAFT_115298 [Melampsora larici-populina 98AG31]EGG11539.1 hypothetical protein MELLADRAFT_115298 [Melampsora larici-populina 98AG31]